MDLLFKHYQEKKETKSNSKSICDLKLFGDDNKLIYTSLYHFNYQRYGSNKNVTFEHMLDIDINNGDLQVTYKIINENLTDDKMFRNSTRIKKNDFRLLLDLTENGFERGEKRIGYWGVKYTRCTEQILNIICEKIKHKFNSDYTKNKILKGEYQVNFLYDMLVDFHLNVKGIKGHNNVYFDIQNDYPKKKWLLKNDNKFLPAILDSYGIKSKFLISCLNKTLERPIHLGSLNYLCKLFGENHIEYLKKIAWELHCYDLPPNNKTHELKNDSEKSCMVKTINNWETESLRTDSLVYSLNKLFVIRDLLESRGVVLKFKAKTDSEFENHMESWSGIKFHFARGYKVKYDLPVEFINDIEQDIKIGNEIFKPKVLINEDEFRLEGYNMKNCMSKQFQHGSLYIFVAIQHKRKRINLQYRKGRLVQSYGKANTAVLPIFNNATDILSDRFSKYTNMEWKKEKYDFISH
jgi:hypothetical protein